jgi:hypothetical protein
MIRVISATIIVGFCQLAQAQNNGLLQRNDLIDTLRFYQLVDSGKSNQLGIANHSFTIRPFKAPVSRMKGTYVALNNVIYSRNYNDSVPTGYNNESFFQATGWQDRFSIGVSAKLGPVEIDLQPEWVLAQNKTTALIPSEFNDANFFSRYYFMNINVIDLPSRFGTSSITKFFPGQSSVKFRFNQFSAGLSTENIWWGPGIRNSLVMTNQAPGFPHLSLQTEEPVITDIGSFEGQAIYGWLDSSGVEPVENARQATIWAGAYEPKLSQSNRNIFGFALTWQPKWVPDFYIGVAMSHYFYTVKKDSLDKPFQDYPYTASKQDKYHASLGSIFFRYAMPDEKAELYLEIGRADKPASFFNILGDTVPLGYTAGLRKIISLRKKEQFIELAVEITRLELPDARLVFSQNNPYGIPKTNSWYTHPRIRQGYTHYGQTLGAGIGPGSNSQTIYVNWIKRFNKIGLRFERVVHNEDFYKYAYISGNIGTGVSNAHWADLSYGLHTRIQYRNFIFAGAATFLSALNHQWVKVATDTNYDGSSSISDKNNFQLTFSVLYNFGLRKFFKVVSF